MALVKRGSIWWVDIFVGGGRKRIRRSTGSTDKSVALIMEQTLRRLAGGKTPRDRALAMIDAVVPPEDRSIDIMLMVKAYETLAAEENLKLLKREMRARVLILGKLAQWCHDRTGIKAADEIDHNVAWEFSKAIGATGVSVKTRNNMLGHLGTIWKMFQKHGKVSENPWGLVRARRDQSEERTGRAYTDDEVDRILEACRRHGDDWETIALISLYTGLRYGDCVSLRWSEVDLDGGWIVRAPSKTTRHGITVRVPIHQKLGAAIRRIDRDGEFLFPRGVDWYRKTKVHSKTPFSAILREAGISEGVGEKLSFHSLRHTFVTRLANAGVSQDVRMRLAGHSDASTNDIYTHDSANAQRAISSLK